MDSTDTQNVELPAGARSLHERVRRFARKPGKGWSYLGSAVYGHTSGVRVHLLGLARFPNRTHSLPSLHEEVQAMMEQGWNRKRALMVWALSAKAPNGVLSDGGEKATPKE